MHVAAVIGANYGDEGKGLIVDYLARDYSLVVRFNGGAQAGHTVTLADGRRHVFHHFGSGSFRGAATFLSEYFIVNPVVFAEELMVLKRLGVSPTVIVDPNATITTPWDMMVNQALEARRLKSRHGSCGLGVHETVVRNEVAPFRVSDLCSNSGAWLDRLAGIREVYISDRMGELGLSKEDIPLLHSPAIYDRFLADLGTLKSNITTRLWGSDLTSPYPSVIFEGAQGLQLAQDAVGFPHVTHSHTGITNVVKMAVGAGIELVDAYYVTRPYLTRHGAGPLPNELPGPPTFLVRDATNITNEWQGSLRFADLDISTLRNDISADVIKGDGIQVRPHVVVTCLDHVHRRVYWKEGSKVVSAKKEELPLIIASGIARSALTSNGPTREAVREIYPAQLPSSSADTKVTP
jgi:adenylosuccinate synthase